MVSLTIRVGAWRRYRVHGSDEPVSRRPRLESVSEANQYIRPIPTGTGLALLWPVDENPKYGSGPDFRELFYVGWRDYGR